MMIMMAMMMRKRGRRTVGKNANLDLRVSAHIARHIVAEENDGRNRNKGGEIEE